MEFSEQKYYSIALEFYIQAKYKKAIEFSKKALKVKLNFLDAHLLLANTYSKLGKNDKTELYLKNALNIEPKNPNVLKGLVYFYYHKKRYRDCMEMIERYTSLKPEDHKMKTLKFYVLLNLGYYKKSYLMISQLIANNTNFSEFASLISKKKENSQYENRTFFGELHEKKSSKIKEFHEKVKNYQEYPDEFPIPEPEDSLEISFLYLFNGELKKAMKYLVYARKLQEEHDS